MTTQTQPGFLGRMTRRHRFVAAATVTAAALVAAGLGLSGSAEAADPVTPPIADAREAIVDVIEATTEVLVEADGDLPTDVSGYAAGFVKGEIQALAIEREQQGYTQTGEAVITRITNSAINTKVTPATMTLYVCVDTSQIDVLDASGKSLKALLYDPGHPVLNVYTAQNIKNDWKIISHDIPEGGSCS